MRQNVRKAPLADAAAPVSISCRDGMVLAGHLWSGARAARLGTVIVNPATGVLARYYHYYARFLSESGFDVLTYDYRGIGMSRPADLRHYRCGWLEWGELDFDAALRFARTRDPDGFLAVVGHSIGGFLPGFAASATAIDRMLTMGAQYAYWPDYRHRQKAALLLKWHVAMPLLTAVNGYFPGRRLGWLEDLPAGVAYEWSFRGPRMERSYPAARRAEILGRFAAVKASILAVSMSDDPFGTPRAVRRALSYYAGSQSSVAELSPQTYGMAEIGHFSLFHNRHADDFWQDTLEWLRDGRNPWPAPS